MRRLRSTVRGLRWRRHQGYDHRFLPGEVYFFRGTPGGTFLAAEKIKNKYGLPINVGGGVREQGDSLYITGDAKFTKDGDDDVVEYNGKKYKNTPEKQILVTGCASAVCVVDWNGDGLLDLVVGEIQGRVGVYLNYGTSKAYKFGEPVFLQAAGKELRVPGGDAGPYVADWDADGVPDLICGAGDGSVLFYRNEGSAKEPKLATAVTLVPASAVGYTPPKTSEAQRGTRAKICVADWNGDGKLDLLVGDFAMQKPAPIKRSPEEEKKATEAKKRFDSLMKEYQTNVQKIMGPNRVKDKKAAAEARDKMQAMVKELTELQGQMPQEYEQHGWVWVFERVAIETRSAVGKKE